MSHVFSFEIWRDDQFTPTAPQPQVPVRYSKRVVADRPADARASVARHQLADGEHVGAGSHHRASCDPPHVGRNVPYRLDAAAEQAMDAAANPL